MFVLPHCVVNPLENLCLTSFPKIHTGLGTIYATQQHIFYMAGRKHIGVPLGYMHYALSTISRQHLCLTPVNVLEDTWGQIFLKPFWTDLAMNVMQSDACTY